MSPPPSFPRCHPPSLPRITPPHPSTPLPLLSPYITIRPPPGIFNKTTRSHPPVMNTKWRTSFARDLLLSTDPMIEASKGRGVVVVEYVGWG